MTTADRIKIRRTELGLTQEDLAKKMGLSDRSSVTRIEHSGNNVSFKQVSRIAQHLNCTPAYLLGMTDRPEQGDIIVSKPQQIEAKIQMPQTTLEKIRGIPPKTATITVPATTDMIVGEVRKIHQLTTDKESGKITGVKVIKNKRSHRSTSDKEKLIKMILDMDESNISHLLRYAEFIASKKEGE